MVEWITWPTYSGGVESSGERGLASPAKQTPIPRSGSFTEGCTVFSVGNGSIGRSTVTEGLGGRGHAAHGQTTAS
jgi:hypothetical protein